MEIKLTGKRRDIDSVIFDLGNVLLSFDPIEYLREDFEDEALLELVCKEVFGSKEWLQLDRGTIDMESFIQIISGRIPEHSELLKNKLENWEEILVPIQASIDLIPGLKEEGYKLYILSNFHKQAFENVYKKYDFFKYFHGRVISSDWQLLKPEKEIYLKLIELYGLDPKRTLFIDDSKDNIEAASALGFHTVHFQKAEQVIAFFKNSGSL